MVKTSHIAAVFSRQENATEVITVHIDMTPLIHNRSRTKEKISKRDIMVKMTNKHQKF